MDDLNFIRQHVRKILAEAEGEEKTRGLGRTTEEVKGQVEYAKRNPGKVMEKFGISDISFPESTKQITRISEVLKKIKNLSLNAEDFGLAVEKVELSGNEVRVHVATDEVEDTSKPRIPTSRLGLYVKAILAAAGGTGKIKYDDSSVTVRMVTGKYVVVTAK